MGWWTIANERGGIDWTRKNKQEQYIGDGPADELDDALRRIEIGGEPQECFRLALCEIVNDYRSAWERVPKAVEIDALWNFCTSQIGDTSRELLRTAWDQAVSQINSHKEAQGEIQNA